jgi:hypothetical protein
MLPTSSPLHPFRALRPGLVALLLGLLLGLESLVGAQSLIQHVAGPDGTRFGASVAVIDDLDGDGVPDTVVGAPRSGGMNLPGYVKVLSGKCGGTWAGYGAGLAGSGGLLPTLTGEGCPGLGLTPKARIANALGGATAWVVGGPAPAALAFKGGTLLVDPVSALIVPLPLSGPAGVPGAGTLVLTIPLPDLPIYLGVTLRLQTLVPDAAAPAGWAMTAGLELTIG